MSAVSVLKRKSLAPVDAHVNEFAALEDLDSDARPVKTRSRKVDVENAQQQLNGARREDPLSSRWIRANLKVTQTRKGPQVVWTPWKNGAELAMIRDWFFPQHAVKDPYSPPTQDLRKRAVSTINRWEEENRDLELPHSIIATSNLTDALLHDTKPTGDRAQHISDQALQSIYAMAFCRFVNGFVDRDVSKSSLTALVTTTVTDADGTMTSTAHGESSMYALASKIGLPLRFVDLRHQITHEKMPSIEELAELTEEGLEWMYRRWWMVYAAFDSAEAWQHWRGAEEQSSSSGLPGRDAKRRADEFDNEGSMNSIRTFNKTSRVQEADIMEEIDGGGY